MNALLLLAAAIGGASPAGVPVVLDTEVITGGLSTPTCIAVVPGDQDRLFFSTRSGVIRIVDNGALLPGPFLDISAQVRSSPAEQAFASFTFHPDYASNGFFYVVYTNLATDSVIARFTVSGDPDLADPASQANLLVLEQPALHHNVDWLGFGPDGYLYVSSGDGGLFTDGIFAQDLESMLGKLLRVDVDGGSPWSIPPDNPFVGEFGLDEIWAVGLRNPWRCSFDRLTGDLWIADVGRNAWEEFNVQPAASAGGENYGWNCEEGNDHCHNPKQCVCGDAGLVPPVYEYPHSIGCAVIGGYVYRGSAMPPVAGKYFFGDYCVGKVWTYEPGSGAVEEVLSPLPPIVSFGEDNDGELYIATAIDLRRIVPADCNGNGVGDFEDIAGGGSDDCDADGIPDECEPDCNANGVADECDIAGGRSTDINGNGVPDECDDAADIDGDGEVGTSDLLQLLMAWGACPAPPAGCPADLNADGTVGTADLLFLLTQWGT